MKELRLDRRAATGIATFLHIMGSWRLLDHLREDNRAIVRAASAASKAADYLLAFRDRLPDPARPLNDDPALAEKSP